MGRTGMRKRTRGWHVIRTAGVLVGVLSTWLILAPPAGASWTAVVTLSAAGWQGQDWPVVAVSRQGESLLVWSACKTGGTECIFQVQAQDQASQWRDGVGQDAVAAELG